MAAHQPRSPEPTVSPLEDHVSIHHLRSANARLEDQIDILTAAATRRESYVAHAEQSWIDLNLENAALKSQLADLKEELRHEDRGVNWRDEYRVSQAIMGAMRRELQEAVRGRRVWVGVWRGRRAFSLPGLRDRRVCGEDEGGGDGGGGDGNGLVYSGGEKEEKEGDDAGEEKQGETLQQRQKQEIQTFSVRAFGAGMAIGILLACMLLAIWARSRCSPSMKPPLPPPPPPPPPPHASPVSLCTISPCTHPSRLEQLLEQSISDAVRGAGAIRVLDRVEAYRARYRLRRTIRSVQRGLAVAVLRHCNCAGDEAFEAEGLDEILTREMERGWV